MTGLAPGCGRRRFASLAAAAKAVQRGAAGSPEPCMRFGVLHYHLMTGTAGRTLQAPQEITIPAEVRALVLERDSRACVCCGTSIYGQRYSLGHRLRASQGGQPVPSNLITLLGWGGELHHGRIDSRRDPADEANGYTLRSWQDPLLVPLTVVSPGGLRAVRWLADDGRYRDTAPERAA